MTGGQAAVGPGRAHPWRHDASLQERDEPTQTEPREALTNCIIITQSTSRVEHTD